MTKYRFPVLNPQDRYEWYDKNRHTVVCPFNLMYDDQRISKIRQLEQLGGQIIGEIDTAVDFSVQFILYKLPEWLKLDEEADEHQIYEFVDKKDRHRLRVCGSLIMAHTNIWTKYHPQSRMSNDCKKMIATVQDLEQIDLDLDDTDEEGIVWEQSSDHTVIKDAQEPAEAWLDKNYPDWRNPTAYWTE